MDFITQLCVERDERAATLVSVSDKRSMCVSELWPVLISMRDTTLFLLFALFKYCEIRIHYAPVESTMLIDPKTGKNLEFVKNVMRKKSSHTLFGQDKRQTF